MIILALNFYTALRPPPPRSLDRPPSTYVIEGPQAIPSPEYGTREVSLYPTLHDTNNNNNNNIYNNSSNDNKGSKEKNSNDIALARSIFKPTIFDPSPFGGEVSRFFSIA